MSGFIQLSRGVFKRARDAAWLRKHFKIILSIYRAIRMYALYYSLEGWNYGDEDGLMDTLAANLQELRSVYKVNLTVHPWHILIFVRASWYYRMHARYVRPPFVVLLTNMSMQA
jgi:hypothetical protein